jgi:hypothetical protein
MVDGVNMKLEIKADIYERQLGLSCYRYLI